MKIQIQLDSQCEEPEILIRTAAVTAEVRELVEKLSEKRSDSVIGYDADSAVLLEKSQIMRIYGASQKVYAQTPHGEFYLRQRLYELEQLLDEKTFVRISKSEIINLRFVKRLDLSITGTIGIQLKNVGVLAVNSPLKARQDRTSFARIDRQSEHMDVF